MRWAFACATGNSDQLRYVGLQANVSTVRMFANKQASSRESRMEYYWELRSKNAQNIKALMYPLYREVTAGLQ